MNKKIGENMNALSKNTYTRGWGTLTTRSRAKSVYSPYLFIKKIIIDLITNDPVILKKKSISFMVK